MSPLASPMRPMMDEGGFPISARSQTDGLNPPAWGTQLADAGEFLVRLTTVPFHLDRFEARATIHRMLLERILDGQAPESLFNLLNDRIIAVQRQLAAEEDDLMGARRTFVS
jgi:hypothetical protein